MTCRRTVFALAFGLTVSSASAQDRRARGGVAANVPRPQGIRPNNHPAQQKIDKLMQMTPQERQRSLQALPPARRENIERRLAEIQKLPAAQQNRIRTRQEMLNRLPPQQQNQVRKSVRQFMDMPEERRAAINQELNRMSTMPGDERQAYMKSEEFRNKYSAREQQMLSHLAEITPPPE
jgi:hypothetical protein